MEIRAIQLIIIEVRKVKGVPKLWALGSVTININTYFIINYVNGGGAACAVVTKEKRLNMGNTVRHEAI